MSTLKVPFAAAVVAAVSFAPAISFGAAAASFDCKKASTAIEKLICSDNQLSELDGQLARSYRKALAGTPHPDSLRSEQRTWLAGQRNRCADVACLKEAYRLRLAALAGAGSGAPPPDATAGSAPPFSFTRPPFVNPEIISELSTGTADEGDHVIAINLTDAQGSNRFSGELEAVKGRNEHPYVRVRSEPDEPGGEQREFGYRYVGRTTSGIDVLRTTESGGGGSGVFENLLLVKVEADSGGGALETAGKNQIMTFKKKRWLISKLGEVSLGDRWNGQLKVSGNEIQVGKDEGFFSDREKTRGYVIKVDAPR